MLHRYDIFTDIIMCVATTSLDKNCNCSIKYHVDEHYILFNCSSILNKVRRRNASRAYSFLKMV